MLAFAQGVSSVAEPRLRYSTGSWTFSHHPLPILHAAKLVLQTWQRYAKLVAWKKSNALAGVVKSLIHSTVADVRANFFQAIGPEFSPAPKFLLRAKIAEKNSIALDGILRR